LLSSAFHHVSPCFFSRDAKEGECEDMYVNRLIAEYEEMFQTLGPSSVAAIMIEPMVEQHSVACPLHEAISLG